MARDLTGELLDIAAGAERHDAKLLNSQRLNYA